MDIFNCNHEFEKIANPVLKTLDGFYKNEMDYKEEEYFEIYKCVKCGKIKCIDITKDELSKNEKLNKVKKR